VILLLRANVGFVIRECFRSFLLLLLLVVVFLHHVDSFDAVRVPSEVGITIENIIPTIVESRLRFTLGRIPRSFFLLCIGFDLRSHRQEHVVELRGIGRVVRIDDRNEGRSVSSMIHVRLPKKAPLISRMFVILESVLTQSIIAKYG